MSLTENNKANWIDDDVSATDVLHSSQETVVHGTQELDELENSKSSILNRMSLFREKLREAEVFVYDTVSICIWANPFLCKQYFC